MHIFSVFFFFYGKAFNMFQKIPLKGSIIYTNGENSITGPRVERGSSPWRSDVLPVELKPGNLQ